MIKLGRNKMVQSFHRIFTQEWKPEKPQFYYLNVRHINLSQTKVEAMIDFYQPREQAKDKEPDREGSRTQQTIGTLIYGLQKAFDIIHQQKITTLTKCRVHQQNPTNIPKCHG